MKSMKSIISDIPGSNVGRFEPTLTIPALVGITLLGVETSVFLDVLKGYIEIAPIASLQRET